MQPMRNKRFAWIFVAVVGAFVSITIACTNNGCTDNRSSLLLAGFYTVGDDPSKPVGITIDSLEIGGVGAPDDSLLVNASERVSQLYLPLRSYNTESAFYIHYASKVLDYTELNDTITLAYDSEAYFASQECGAIYRYRIRTMEYTRHLIDSVALPDSLINNVDVERMKIFFRTASADEVKTATL